MANQPIKLSDAVIPCPLVGFALRRARHCLECKHYQGLSQATVNGEPIEGNEADMYQVICAKPITRRMQSIIE